MAFIDKIVKFHTFSKSTVRENLTLGEAVNPSGHTVTSSQVRTDDIPAFIDTFQDTKEAALTWAAANVDANARHNDILYYGGKFNMGFGNPKCLIRVAKQEVDGKLVDLPAEQHTWADFTITDKSFLANADGKNVIAIHKDAEICYVHGDNNAAVNSNENSAFVRKSDGTFLDHFVAPTDQILGGQPSLGYGLCLFLSGANNGKAFTEGEVIGDNNYISNSFAGLIHFMDKRTETADTEDNYRAIGFSVNCFEYIGDKLDTSISGLRQSIKDISDVTLKGVVASVTADANTAQKAGITVDNSVSTTPVIKFTAGSVATGENRLVTGGSIAQAITNAIDALGDVAVKDDIKITDIKVKQGSEEAESLTITNKSVTIEIPEVPEADVTADGDVTTDGFTKTAAVTYLANAAIDAAISDTNGAIADAIDSAISGATLSDADNAIANSSSTGEDPTDKKLVTAAQVKEYVTENAQVTVTVGETNVTSTGFEFAGSTGDDVSIAAEMDENGKVTYSATLSKATVGNDGAITNGSLAVSATDAKTIAQTAIKDELASEVDGSLGDIISDVKNTADSAVQSVGKGGSSSLLSVTGDTNVVISLSDTVADQTYVTTAVNGLKDTAIASQSVSGSGITVTLGNKVGAPTLTGSVTTASYTPASGDVQGKWTDSTLSNVVTGTDVKNALADVAAAHTKDIKTIEAAIEAITTSGFERIVVTELPTTGIKLNAIYLKANNESEINEYIEYIYVGGSIVEGQVTGGSFEQIGTTKTDLTEYATKSYVDAAVKTAKDAADAAQATIDEFIAETYAADKSALEDSISGVSQVVASNHGEFTEFVNTTYAADKKTIEDSVATKIATVSVTTDATHFGAEHIESVTDANKNVTITVTRNAEWSIGSTKPANTITSVINGKMSNGHTVDDANLVNGTSMYAGNTSLTTYVGSLGKLTNGTNMFSGCTSLSTFVADLTSLTTGNGMFANCKLTEESLIYIVDTLPTVTSGTITVGVADGVDKSKYVTEASTKGWTLA